jgi:hypothetical protein
MRCQTLWEARWILLVLVVLTAGAWFVTPWLAVATALIALRLIQQHAAELLSALCVLLDLLYLPVAARAILSAGAPEGKMLALNADEATARRLVARAPPRYDHACPACSARSPLSPL